MRMIRGHNTVITEKPTLTTSIGNTNDKSGLYMSTDTNSGEKTYYFRGNVENNYVSFAEQTWRIVRINEDGTVRLIKDDIVPKTKHYNSVGTDYNNMYYSNSEIKPIVDQWYIDNLLPYDDKIVTSSFCEQAKVKNKNEFISGNVNMNITSDYTPTFKCETDTNGYGIINAKIGFITYDEVQFGGGYNRLGDNYYLNNNSSYWTMSPGAVDESLVKVWGVSYIGELWDYRANNDSDVYIRPVINLKSSTSVTGTRQDPYVVQ